MLCHANVCMVLSLALASRGRGVTHWVFGRHVFLSSNTLKYCMSRSLL